MAEGERSIVTRCPNPECEKPIWTDHPYFWCFECGEKLPKRIQERLPRLQEIKEQAAAERANLAVRKSEAAESVEVLGRPLHCAICGHDRFLRREATVGTFQLFSQLDWEAYCFACDRCGYLHWFLPGSQRAGQG